MDNMTALFNELAAAIKNKEAWQKKYTAYFKKYNNTPRQISMAANKLKWEYSESIKRVKRAEDDVAAVTGGYRR